MSGEIDRITQGQLVESKEDIVGLWLIVKQIERSMPGLDFVELQEHTREVVERLLAAGLVFGQFDDEDRFQIWSEPVWPRIEEEWSRLGRSPAHMAEIGSFIDLEVEWIFGVIWE